MIEYHNNIYFALSSDVMYSVDTSLRLTSISPGVENALGYRPEELTGRPFMDLGLLHGDDLDKAVADTMRLLSGEKFPPSVYRFITRKGEIRWGEVRAAPLIEHGKLTEVIAVARDITNRVQLEEELRKHQCSLEETVRQRTAELAQANERLRREIEERTNTEKDLLRKSRVDNAISESYKLLALAGVSISYICGIILAQARELTGSDHGYVAVIDPSNGDCIGHTSTEMAGNQCNVKHSLIFPMSTDGTYPGLWGYSLNSRMPMFSNAPMEHAASSGIPEGHVELANFLAVPVSVRDRLVGQISLANKPGGYDNNDLESIGMLGEFFSLAIQHKQAEKALRESEEKYRLLVENARDAIFVAQDGMLRFVNSKCMELSGYSQEELVTRPFIHIIHPEDREMVAERHWQRMSGEELAGVYSFRIADREGSVKWVEINAVPIPWDGRPAALTFLKDITESKRDEEELRTHRERLEDLVRKRTADLTMAYEHLKWENHMREKTETALRSREMELVEKQRSLEEMNTALRILLMKREEDKEAIETDIKKNIKTSVLPYLERLRSTILNKKQTGLISQVECRLNEIASSYIRKLSSEYIGLSPREYQVALLIKEGKSSKDIAEILDISIHTVNYHRLRIRKKAWLKSRRSNLGAFLKTLE